MAVAWRKLLERQSLSRPTEHVAVQARLISVRSADTVIFMAGRSGHPRAGQACQHHCSSSICSFLVSVSHFSNFCIVSILFNIVIFTLVMGDYDSPRVQ